MSVGVGFAVTSIALVCLGSLSLLFLIWFVYRYRAIDFMKKRGFILAIGICASSIIWQWSTLFTTSFIETVIGGSEKPCVFWAFWGRMIMGVSLWTCLQLVSAVKVFMTRSAHARYLKYLNYAIAFTVAIIYVPIVLMTILIGALSGIRYVPQLNICHTTISWKLATTMMMTVGNIGMLIFYALIVKQEASTSSLAAKDVKPGLIFAFVCLTVQALLEISSLDVTMLGSFIIVVSTTACSCYVCYCYFGRRILFYWRSKGIEGVKQMVSKGATEISSMKDILDDLDTREKFSKRMSSTGCTIRGSEDLTPISNVCNVYGIFADAAKMELSEAKAHVNKWLAKVGDETSTYYLAVHVDLSSVTRNAESMERFRRDLIAACSPHYENFMEGMKLDLNPDTKAD